MSSLSKDRPVYVTWGHGDKCPYVTLSGAERQSKYLFIKSFKDSANGIGKVYNYMHVTVSKDGNEVSISNHDLDSSKVRK